MTNRSAIHTIKGYFYQFDYSIKKLLELQNKSDSIIIERIEDVDIKTATEETAIQCKYYAQTEYNHSVIAKPIRFMLTHFVTRRSQGLAPINYLLYGYYSGGQNKLANTLSLDEFKEYFLNYTKTDSKTKKKVKHHKDIGADDNCINDFMTLLSIDINAQEFEDQYSDIVTQLQSVFNCNQFEANQYYYNNALKLVKDLSIQENDINRTITKRDFLEKINNKAILFNQWFIDFKGLKNHHKELRKEYFSSLNVSPFDRLFLIEVDSANYSRPELKDLLLFISKKWTKISKRDKKPFCPYVFINGITETELINIKTELINENHPLLDGFDFQGATFSVKSLLKEPNYVNGVKIKFINEIAFVNQVIQNSLSTKEIYQFYINSPFYSNDSDRVKHVKIQVQELKHIKEIV